MSHVAIVTHEHLPGAPHFLRDYLNSHKISRLTFIAHPLVDRSGNSYCETFVNGVQIRKSSIPRSWALPGISYPIDTILTIVWLFRAPIIDRYIAVGPLNALAGIVLKSLGQVRNVTLYSIDFTPRRFANRIVNALYHMVEKTAVVTSDIRWDVSPRIREGRMKFLGMSGYDPIVVPIGVEERYIAKRAVKRHPYRIGFVGHLLEKQGVQLMLQALPSIVKKFPQVEFLVIGGGEYKKKLEDLTSRLHITQRVKFTDWIADQEKVASLLAGCSIGIATYVPNGATETNFTYFADPTKIKTYLAAGLPVILTDVPYNARELEKRSCAVVIPYDVNALTDTVTRLFSDNKRLKAMRESALHEAKHVLWESVFQKAVGL